jgi:hypothetical protein
MKDLLSSKTIKSQDEKLQIEDICDNLKTAFEHRMDLKKN